GRYWAMDRDTRWDRVEKAWQALVNGQGLTAEDPLQAVKDAYAREETDEFIKPTVLLESNGEPAGRISDGDAVVFFNFRADRVRELCHAFANRASKCLRWEWTPPSESRPQKWIRLPAALTCSMTLVSAGLSANSPSSIARLILV
ncbi:MAG: hypothetical protein D3914_07855, partial [Candidatus Electrothrix sp. LOE2]|nr:hypothetical protein [Candidatus Electrothrix sp. LOE2]